MRKCVQNRLIRKSLIAAAAAFFTSVPVTADDLDVFDALLANQNKPNILFVLDYSSSMRKRVQIDETTSLSRISILKTAVNTLLETNKGKINVGIGSLFSRKASGARWPISDLEEDAHNIDPDIPAGTVDVAAVISSQLERSGLNTGTATVNGLAEAAAYFRGDLVLHSDAPLEKPYEHMPDLWDGDKYASGNPYAAMPSTYFPSNAYEFDSADSVGNYDWCTNYTGGDQECEGKSTFDCEIADETTEVDLETGDTWTTPAHVFCKYDHTDNFTVPNYVSPLTKSCQANFIVLISDGRPTVLNDNTTLQAVLKDAGVPAGKINKCEDLSTSVFSEETKSKSAGNCGPELLNYLATNAINPDINDSNVRTFTVGFAVEGPGKKYLELLAEKGLGKFYEATKPAELSAVLNMAIEEILTTSNSFAELQIDVDPSTFSHSNQTYLSMFSPSIKSSWQGNLKGFFIDSTGLIDVNGNSATVIEDAAGLVLADTSHSFWSSVPDGNDVTVGGASESITDLPPAPNTRNMLTNLGGAGLTNMIDITDNSLLGITADEQRIEALEWLSNAPMGDPLHTKPVVVNYKTAKIIYVMTNQGFLHAFDATKPTTPGAVPPDLTGGEELFAFMPQELLSNIPKLHKPNVGAEHIYGLDGTITRWHDDINGNGLVDGADSITLIIGMRRGGTSYYALDVTNPTSPEFKWQISKDDPGFARLAQSWSRASLVSVNNNGNKERVLMFGGGYDADAVDGQTTPTPASGNAIFMVDVDGTLIWSLDEVDHIDMIYSIPSDLSIIDSDQNGMVDRAYFGDLGGQVWRIDFDNIANTSDITLTKFADISNGEYQPLFYPPSISMNRHNAERFMAVSFGSGDRTQPMLVSSKNAFYMLRDIDYEVGEPEPSFTTITTSQVYDATENDIGSDNDSIKQTAKTELETTRGWMVHLNAGEKPLSKVVTFQGKFLATTFEPDTAVTTESLRDSCKSSMVGRLYTMRVADAQPISINSDGTESNASLDSNQRYTHLNEKMTIPGPPVIVFPPGGSQVQIVVGKESVVSLNKLLKTVFWHAK